MYSNELKVPKRIISMEKNWKYRKQLKVQQIIENTEKNLNYSSEFIENNYK
mgnify:CR=1 FL=1